MQHAPGFLKLVNDARGTVREVSVADTQRRMASGVPVHVFDIREESEWAAGHAVGATHLGKGIIERDIEAKVPDPGDAVILYCGGGFRSVLAADALQRMGYTNVASMAGGWRAWVEAGAPTER